MRILYVEDEKFLADAVIHLLKKSGINVDWAGDGALGLELARTHTYDCLVLDIMLPSLSGLDILSRLRKTGDPTPIIMLSALSEVEDKIKALDVGADDYLGKPFKTSELVARIRAVARRPRTLAPETLKYADLSYDTATHTLNGHLITEKQALILEMFLKSPETIIRKEQILAHVWGSSVISEENYVEVYISYLRRILKDLNAKSEIKNIRGLGYKLTMNSKTAKDNNLAKHSSTPKKQPITNTKELHV